MEQESSHAGATGSPESGGAGTDPDASRVEATREALAEARRRVLETRAEVVVVNHVMGLYELAAIHLSAAPVNLAEAALAIDAVACLVDGLGDRLSEQSATLHAALQNIRMAYVQIKATTSA